MIEGTEEVKVYDENCECTGLAKLVNNQIGWLFKAKELAITLESELNTKSDINDVATALRAALLDVSKDTHTMYSQVLFTKKSLLSSVGEVQAKDKKEKVEAEIKALQAKLKGM